MLGPPGFSFQLSDDPQRGAKPPSTFKVTYLAGTVTLRDTPRVILGFRVDPAHPGDKSQLLKSNIDTAKNNGLATSAVSADGGAGVSFVNTGKSAVGVNQFTSVVAKDAVTVTINVDGDPAAGDDQAAKSLHDKLLASLAFRADGLAGAWPGSVMAPQLPFTVAVPTNMAKDTYPSTLSSYFLELGYGTTYKSTLGITWETTQAATKQFASIRANLDKAGVKHQSDVRTLPALRDSLGTRVDEGFSFNLTGADGLPRYVGVVWRKDGVIVRSQANIGNVASSSFTADSNAALATPMSIAKTWTWSP